MNKKEETVQDIEKSFADVDVWRKKAMMGEISIGEFFLLGAKLLESYIPTVSEEFVTAMRKEGQRLVSEFLPKMH